MAALGVMNALFDGTKQFLMVAEDRLLVILMDMCNLSTLSYVLYLR